MKDKKNQPKKCNGNKIRIANQLQVGEVGKPLIYIKYISFYLKIFAKSVV